AYLVLGLIQRNQQNFSEANKLLTAARKYADGAKGSWAANIEAAYQGLVDPNAYFLPKAEQLAAAGDIQGAQKVLNLGLKALPNNGLLLARRAQLRLDSVRGKAPVEVSQTIRSGAEAAAQDAAAAAPARQGRGQL